MKIAVRYYTKSGNTLKLAQAIAKAVDVKEEDVSVKLKEDVDILFLGSSLYGGRADEKVVQFIDEIDVKVGLIVNFSTAAIFKSTYKHIKRLVKKKNIKIAKEEFHCKGSAGKMNPGKPDETDLEQVSAFAKECIEKY